MKRSNKIFVVGSPNVGKSSVFNAITKSYVTVSNYPGTTVDISTGKLRIGAHHQFEVVDTPGMYSLRPITAEEGLTRASLLREMPACIVHVVDAKNLERMLSLTIQLMETGHPVILVLNMYDELEASGKKLDLAHLEHDLGIPVVATVAVRGTGIDHLITRIVEVTEERYKFGEVVFKYPPEIEERIARIGEMLGENFQQPRRSVAALLLQGDPGLLEELEGRIPSEDVKKVLGHLSFLEMAQRLSQARLEITRGILAEHLAQAAPAPKEGWSEKLSHVMTHPVWGLPFLAVVLWFGLYQFVGKFGAGTLVDWIENGLFEARINPWVNSVFQGWLGDGSVLFDLFAGEYGILTLAIRYAFAIVLPIVATFFIAFSIIEDTGYLPRLAMLLDHLFKRIGLSGRAVIPITLGFGCDTMATIVTRTLETNKERIIATFLLSLAIPCSAQLGVLMGILGGHPAMFAIWAGTVSAVFLISGFLAKKLLRGEPSSFAIELPPLRLPSVVNVFTKTYTRLIWYFIEVVPIFIYASILIWFGKITGLFDILVRLMAYPVRWAGMPAEMSPVFLYGFFRRDFGAAGLFDMARDGMLSGNAILIAAVVLTLFVPCIAQFVVTWKERGKWMAIGMALFIFPFAFFVGFILNVLLSVTGVAL